MAQAFDFVDTIETVGAPLFAFFAKGGYGAACSAGFDSAEISWYKQHRTRPCRERKDGAPTVSEWERKTNSERVGHPSNIGDPKSLHLYLYAEGDPVNRNDPTGNQATITEVSLEAAITITLAVITTLAVLANTHARIEIPFRVNHYTQWAFVLSILANGLNQPTNYVTTDWYLWGGDAKTKLAMRLKPQVLINFFVYKNADDLIGPNPVEPANGEPGGGTEYYSEFPIPVLSRFPVVFPLLN